MLVNSEHPEKAAIPIEVTLLGIMELLHPLTNVFVSVFIMALQFSLLSYTLLPSSTDIVSKALQLAKAPYPIEVTLLGISMLVKLVHPEKA